MCVGEFERQCGWECERQRTVSLSTALRLKACLGSSSGQQLPLMTQRQQHRLLSPCPSSVRLVTRSGGWGHSNISPPHPTLHSRHEAPRSSSARGTSNQEQQRLQMEAEQRGEERQDTPAPDALGGHPARPPLRPALPCLTQFMQLSLGVLLLWSCSLSHK